MHRLVLLSNAVEYNLCIEVGSALLSVIPFIENNLNYAATCQYNMHQQICRKCFKIMSYGGSDRIMAASLRLVARLELGRDLVVLIVTDYF